MLAGMAAGIVVMAVLWWTGAVAWTWYAFIGAAVTAGTAQLGTYLFSTGHARRSP